ncbi:hypothetical protein [Patulibacter sp.]|uniref:hypothetical protein n=1 Tax=Patulibacter sp. TaxID=1912859 RepID=UPI00272072C3|nr:hypothetical protein [Patulibacter sp.]MDO9410897.1 hypothetical protein [Patulibacter sp.]
MSRPTSTPNPRPLRRTGRPAVLAAVAAATLVSAASASAATAPVTVQEPLQPAAPGTVLASVGNGRQAWIVQADGAPPVLWTLRDGAAAQVATLPGPSSAQVQQLEVGTAKDGTPVAAVRAGLADGGSTLRLVRLDTGAVRTISSTRRGLRIGGVGLDAGRLYYTLHAAKTTSRSTSSLWRATLTGTSIGRATKLRDSRRGEAWDEVVADRNRVAVETTRPVSDGTGVYARAEWAFGTPRGSWNRTGLVLENDGEFSPVAAAGFTHDRSALVTYQGGFPDGPRAVRTPIRRGKVGTVTAASPADDTGLALAPALDPATGRLLTRGTDASGTVSIGWTAPLFP